MESKMLFGNLFIAKKLTESDSSVTLNNPLMIQNVPFLPTTLSFSIYGAIYSNLKQEVYTIKIIIEDSQGFNPVEINGELKNENLNSDHYVMEINIDVDGAIFKNEGKHKCTLIIDNNIIDGYHFFIKNVNLNLEGDE